MILVKKILISIFILGCAFLFGCDEKDDFARLYSNLIPSENSEYTIYSVGEQIKPEELTNEDLNISDFTLIYEKSLESSESKYPKLELKEEPAYVVFDENGLVVKMDDFESLIQHLKE